MSKFIEIEKVNSYGEKGKAFFKLEDVVGIKENHVESEKMYDANGNVVKETPKPKDFTVLLTNGATYHIEEGQYATLKTELEKQ